MMRLDAKTLRHCAQLVQSAWSGMRVAIPGREPMVIRDLAEAGAALVALAEWAEARGSEPADTPAPAVASPTLASLDRNTLIFAAGMLHGCATARDPRATCLRAHDDILAEVRRRAAEAKP